MVPSSLHPDLRAPNLQRFQRYLQAKSLYRKSVLGHFARRFNMRCFTCRRTSSFLTTYFLQYFMALLFKLLFRELLISLRPYSRCRSITSTHGLLSRPKCCRNSRIRCHSPRRADHKQLFRIGRLKCRLYTSIHVYRPLQSGGSAAPCPVAKERYLAISVSSPFRLNMTCLCQPRVALAHEHRDLFFFIKWPIPPDSCPRPSRDRLNHPPT